MSSAALMLLSGTGLGVTFPAVASAAEVSGATFTWTVMRTVAVNPAVAPPGPIVVPAGAKTNVNAALAGSSFAAGTIGVNVGAYQMVVGSIASGQNGAAALSICGRCCVGESLPP